MANELSPPTAASVQTQVEAALEHARVRARRVVDAAPVALAVFTGDELRYQYANPVYRTLRPAGTRFVGCTFAEVFPRGAELGAGTQIRDVMRLQRPWKIRDFLVDIEGRGATWWEGECLPLENDRGEFDSALMLLWDVTDRHVAEDALRESEQRFHDVFDNAGVAVWIEDFTEVKAALDLLREQGVGDVRAYLAEHPDFVTQAIGLIRVVDVNLEALELFGARSKSELMGTLARVYTPSAEKLFVQDLVALAEGRQSVEAEARLRTLDGRELDTLFNIRFHHGNQRYDHVVLTIVDITARKRAEEALRESEERFRIMADSAPVLIWLTDREGACTWVNHSWTEFTGRTLEDELGDHWLERAHPDDVARVADAYAHAHRNREPLEVEFRLAREDGMYRWLVDYGRPRFGESGAFVGFIGSGIDITERKHAEATVRASEERYRAVIESQSEMLCRFRADGTILFVNGAYARVQGKEPEGIVGTNFWEFVSEDDRADVQAQLDRLTPATPTVNIENRFETAMGTRWTLWTNRALAFDSEGHLLEAQSSGIDISERRAIEEELRRANSVKDELLGMVSHEFRTPLATIIGNLDVLERPATSPGQRARSFQDLRLSSGRLRRLIENMLVLASNRPGLDPEPEPLLLHRLLPAMLAMEQRLDESRPIELQADNGLPPVLGNLGYLEQVLGNLLSNARKYGKKGTPIHVAVTQDQGDVAIAVRDHGDVLASESLDRFFEPFYRDAGGASFVDGVGLGLSVCQRLVHAMGGEITASAHPEGGAIFRFTLPVARDDGEV